MSYQKKVERVNELVREIKERETELESIFGGEKQRAPQKCGSCGETGHTKATCPKPKQDGSPA
jgi:hypothetical protein